MILIIINENTDMKIRIMELLGITYLITLLLSKCRLIPFMSAWYVHNLFSIILMLTLNFAKYENEEMYMYSSSKMDDASHTKREFFVLDEFPFPNNTAPSEFSV